MFTLFLFILNVFLAWLYLRPNAIPFDWLRNIKQQSCSGSDDQSVKLPPLVPQEWTLSELRQYDGVKSKRILIAVDWRVFDVTTGERHYGPGTLQDINPYYTVDGSYAALAGRDATRSLTANKVFLYPKEFTQTFDDYLDLSVEEREAVNGWVEYFYKRYPEVGLLVRVKDDKFVHEEDVFSEPGTRPSGGIMDNLHYQ